MIFEASLSFFNEDHLIVDEDIKNQLKQQRNKLIEVIEHLPSYPVKIFLEFSEFCVSQAEIPLQSDNWLLYGSEVYIHYS